MLLTQAQLQAFDDEGYLFLPDCFSEEEVAALRHEAEAIYRSDRPELWREKSGAPRTAFAAHTYNEGFRLLGAHPRLIEPVEQLFGEQLYMHQYKLNAKAAFDGDVSAMAPGLRCLGARRRHAGAAGDEHLGVSRRGHADQRPADVHSEEPQIGRAAGGP